MFQSQWFHLSKSSLFAGCPVPFHPWGQRHQVLRLQISMHQRRFQPRELSRRRWTKRRILYDWKPQKKLLANPIILTGLSVKHFRKKGADVIPTIARSTIPLSKQSFRGGCLQLCMSQMSWESVELYRAFDFDTHHSLVGNSIWHTEPCAPSDTYIPIPYVWNSIFWLSTFVGTKQVTPAQCVIQ